MSALDLEQLEFCLLEEHRSFIQLHDRLSLVSIQVMAKNQDTLPITANALIERIHKKLVELKNESDSKGI